jgi:hypothetical protein
MTLGFHKFTINYRLIPAIQALIISPSDALRKPITIKQLLNKFFKGMMSGIKFSADGK